jgi:hypothetical protein
MLSAFRRENGARLDQLLSSSLAGLIAEGLIELDEVRIDGTKVAARAGWTAQAKRDRLTRLEQAAAAHVARLKQELEGDAAVPEQQRRQRALQAAQAREARLGRAREKLAELEREKTERAKDHPGEEKAKGAPSVSTADPEVRLMRMADGAVRPAWNVQVATANGFVLVATPTDRRNDSGMAAGLIEQVEQRCGRCPARLLADSKAVTQEEIVALAASRPQLEVYSPPPRERENITAGGLRNRRSRLRHEPTALQHWRARMASEAGKTIYRRRKLTEHAHAHMKNRGFGRMLVHGLRTVHAVCTLYALALNLMQAHRLRRPA